MLSYLFRTTSQSLARVPGYVATIVLTFGLTLGALASMFNLNHLLLVEPLPYPDQDRLFITQWMHHD